jgi:hypothetical protein
LAEEEGGEGQEELEAPETAEGEEGINETGGEEVAIPDIEGINSQDVFSPRATDPAAPSRYPTRVCTAPTT